MPSLQEIERLKTILNELADEPEVRAEQGETIEDVLPPGQELTEGVGDLLGKPGGTGPSAQLRGAPGGFGPVAPDDSFDASSMLGSDDDLGELDSFEDFFGGGSAGAPGGAPGAPVEPAETPAEPAPIPEEAAAAGEEPEEGGAAEWPEAEEDVLAALGLTGESFAEEASAGEPEAEMAGAPEAGPESAPEAGPSLDELLGLEEPEEQEPAGFEAAAGADEAAGVEEAPAGEAEGFDLGEGGDEFGIPPGLLGPLDAGQPAGPEEPGAAEVPEDFELPEEFTLPEFGEEEQTPAPEEAPEEAPESAFGEEAFGLPEEFQMPEEVGEGLPEEAPPVFEDQDEAPAPPSEEEAEFLRALQEEILPGGEEQPLQEEPSPAAPAEGEHVDLEAQEETFGTGMPGEEVPAYEEFSLEGLGEEFGAAEQEEPAGLPEEELAAEIPSELPAEIRADLGAEAPPVAPVFPGERAPGAGAPEAAERPVFAEATGLSDRQFAALRRNLARLPRNLKIVVEELIGEKELGGEDLQKVVQLLIGGAPPAAIAAEVSRITGTRIRIPRSFEKLTGLEFEEERRSFAYAFRENILPILRVAALSLAVVALLSFLGYRYVYRPVQAQVLYRQGYNQIERQRYQLANERFDQALGYWVFKGWFYRYAEAFAGQRQYTLAADKYEQLLRRFPGDRKGVLDYARLLTYDLAGYERADELARGLLERNLKDYGALLARGDNFLEWAAEAPPDQAPSLYEEARFHYASIIDYYGDRDEVLLRMMRYFIRTDKERQTRDLKAYLDGSSLKGVAPGLYASVYAELAGYWMDKGEYDGIADILFKAMEAQPALPEVHYNMARYYLHVRDTEEEARALGLTLRLLEDTQPLTKRRLYMLIDAYRRSGENFWRRGEYLLAEQNFQTAIARIEEVQAQRIFGQEEMFGQVFEDQGDIHYYVSRDLSAALDHYLRAVDNGHRPARLDYKIGYIHYNRERFEEALLRFSTVVDQNPRNENALFSLGNALYLGGFYSSAQGYYLRLLDLLETREERIPLMLIHENPEHRSLAESIMKTYNNLGVTLNSLAAQRRDPDKESAALVNLTFSSEYFDVLSRDPETAARGITRNLAYLNQRGILYPQSDFRPDIYRRIPIDLQARGF